MFKVFLFFSFSLFFSIILISFCRYYERSDPKSVPFEGKDKFGDVSAYVPLAITSFQVFVCSFFKVAH